MAKIVLGLGSSHGPTIRTQPEGWAGLGQKDMEDPRFDYQAVLRTAKPGMEAELAMDKKIERYDACQRAIGKLEEVLTQARPDTVVVLSNLHGEIPDFHQQTLGIFTGDSLPKTERRRIGADFWRRDAEGHAVGHDEPPPAAEGGYPADTELSDYLFQNLNDQGFDVQACGEFGSGSGIGDAFTFIYDLYAKDGTLPMVPFMISRYLPNQATPKRAYQLGLALRRAIDEWDSDKRVAVMASGGLSHQILDEELDRVVVDALLEKDVNQLCSLPRDRLNRAPGTPETLNWVSVAAAMEDTPMTLIDYVPCYRSMAGTGHGVTLAYWG